MRQLRRPSSDESQDSPFTWRTSGPLAGRLDVPVGGAWDRLYASEKRKAMLDSAFSSAFVAQGGAIGLAGPAMTGKSQIALALADLRGLRAIYATEQTEQQAYKPTAEALIIIDPVSAYDRAHVAACVQFYAGSGPVILVDRDPNAIAAIPGVQQIIKLKLPSSSSISAYLHDLIDGPAADAQRRGYPHTLAQADFDQLGSAMHGLSLAQVNQVALDAALSRLQHDQPVDRRAFDSALSAYASMRQASQEASLSVTGGAR